MPCRARWRVLPPCRSYTGALPWQRVVAPGRSLCRHRFPVSQALAVRLASAPEYLAAGRGAGGGVPGPDRHARWPLGAETKNLALGESLSQIRLNGADGFYKAPWRRAIAAYSAAQGGGITAGRTGGDSGAARPGAFARHRQFHHLASGPRATARAPSPPRCWTVFRATRCAGATAAVRQSLANFGIAGLPGDLGSTGVSPPCDARRRGRCLAP